MDDPQHSTLANRIRMLGDMDWSFGSRLARDRRDLPLIDARRHHWYPATFIPELPFGLIEILSSPGDLVADPFAGLGTTLWQASAIGRRARGLEVNLAGAQIADNFQLVFTNPGKLPDCLHAIVSTATEYRESTDYADAFGGTLWAEMGRPWFTKDTFNQFCYLRGVVDDWRLTGDLVEAAFMDLLTDALLKPFCEQRRGWGCIADNMRPTEAQFSDAPARDVLGQLVRSADAFGRDLTRWWRSIAEYGAPLPDGRDVTILRANSSDTQLAPAGSVDLVVTSPPYPGMTDYANSQRLSFYWNNSLPNDTVQKEIGARRKRFAKTWLSDYETQMAAVMANTATSVRTDGFVVTILPAFQASTRGGTDRAKAVESVGLALRDNGLEQIWAGLRSLPSDRRHQNQAWTHLENELITVFAKT